MTWIILKRTFFFHSTSSFETCFFPLNIDNELSISSQGGEEPKILTPAPSNEKKVYFLSSPFASKLSSSWWSPGRRRSSHFLVLVLSLFSSTTLLFLSTLSTSPTPVAPSSSLLSAAAGAVSMRSMYPPPKKQCAAGNATLKSRTCKRKTVPAPCARLPPAS